MISKGDIRHLKREEIDTSRWDKCIDEAENGLIYSYSFYLDAMCDHWDALIFGDYEAVMPLPWRKKWGLKYVYQAAFIQRLGVFGNNLEDVLNAFYKHATKKYLLVHYNVSNPSTTVVQERRNFFIDLTQSYEQIRSFYSNEAMRNIHKAISRGCVFTTNISSEDVIKLFKQTYGDKNSSTSEVAYQKLDKLLNQAKNYNKIELVGVADENNNIIQSAAILKDNKRLYYVIGAPTKIGREKRATYFLIDHLLKINAGTNRLFDFEGSDLPNVASFYKKFGPQTEYYFEIKVGRLKSL